MNKCFTNNPLIFNGAIQCDGYSAYEALRALIEELEIGFCLSHMRRKFIEAGGVDDPVCKEALGWIATIYQTDKRRTGHLIGMVACRSLVRNAYLLPLSEAFKSRMMEMRHGLLPGDAVAKALDYTLRRWDDWTSRVMSGSMELDNNLVENRIRPLKLGAKNWLFNGTLEAGHNNALFYTRIGNCHAHGLNAEEYLEEVIQHLPVDATEEQAAELTPARIAAARQQAAAAHTA